MEPGNVLAEATPLQNWEVISAFLLPLAISAIIRRGWNDGQKAVAAFLIALLWTVVGLVVKGELTWEYVSIETIGVTALKIVALTIPFYYGFWKPTGVAPKIEAATG